MEHYLEELPRRREDAREPAPELSGDAVEM